MKRGRKKGSKRKSSVKSMLVINNKGDVRKLGRKEISKIRRLGKRVAKS